MLLLLPDAPGHHLDTVHEEDEAGEAGEAAEGHGEAEPVPGLAEVVVEAGAAGCEEEDTTHQTQQGLLQWDCRASAIVFHQILPTMAAKIRAELKNCFEKSSANGK